MKGGAHVKLGATVFGMVLLQPTARATAVPEFAMAGGGAVLGGGGAPKAGASKKKKAPSKKGRSSSVKKAAAAATGVGAGAKGNSWMAELPDAADGRDLLAMGAEEGGETYGVSSFRQPSRSHKLVHIKSLT